MPRPTDPTDSPSRPHTWLLTAVTSAVLGLALLALAIAPLAAPASPIASIQVEDEPSEAEFEIGDDGDWVLETVEEWEIEGEEESSDDECPLNSARAHATTKRNKLKLTVGYTTSEPTTARIKVTSGSASLGTYSRRLRRSGVLRFTRSLGRKHGDKVLVDISIPSAGRYCAEEAAVLFR